MLRSLFFVLVLSFFFSFGSSSLYFDFILNSDLEGSKKESFSVSTGAALFGQVEKATLGAPMFRVFVAFVVVVQLFPKTSTW